MGDTINTVFDMSTETGFGLGWVGCFGSRKRVVKVIGTWSGLRNVCRAVVVVAAGQLPICRGFYRGVLPGTTTANTPIELRSIESSGQ